MKIFDAHTHLNDTPFRGKEEVYLQRAAELDVTKMACVGQDLEYNERALDLAKKFDNVYAIVGYCPDVAKDYCPEWEALLIKQLKQPKVVALGEIGLDYYWDESPRDVQKEVFKRQIEIAHDLKLPVNIHTRDAFKDCYEILKNSNLEYGAILHSYNGGPKWTKKFLTLDNVTFSFSGVSSFTKAEDVHASVKLVPLNRIVVETDAPYLTPKPYRGKQNEPAYVYYVAKAISELKEVSLEQVAEATYQNAVTAYGIK